MNLVVDFREEMVGNSVRQRYMQITKRELCNIKRYTSLEVLVSKNLVLMLCVAHLGSKI